MKIDWRQNDTFLDCYYNDDKIGRVILNGDEYISLCLTEQIGTFTDIDEAKQAVETKFVEKLKVFNK